MNFKLEVIIIPVSDVDRAKEFYEKLGWRLDADFAKGDFRVVESSPAQLRSFDHLRQGSHVAEAWIGE